MFTLGYYKLHGIVQYLLIKLCCALPANVHIFMPSKWQNRKHTEFIQTHGNCTKQMPTTIKSFGGRYFRQITMNMLNIANIARK